MYLIVRNDDPSYCNDDPSYCSVASTLGTTRSVACSHVVVMQRRLRAALFEWLELRAAPMSPFHAEPAPHVGHVVDQPVDVAAGVGEPRR